MKEQLNSTALKTKLWDTLNEVKTGTMDVRKANAITGTARGICSIVKLEMQMAKMSGKKPTLKLQSFTK